MLKKTPLTLGTALIFSAVSSAACAGTITLDVQIPQQAIAEYHKPYVAGWLEDGAGAPVAQLFVWYDVKKREGGGLKYLKDLRSWWRKAGRDLTLPIDGVTSATRAPGRQTLTLEGAAALKALPAGQYNLIVEASREGGGHDLVKLPLSYSPAKAATAQGKGDGELGDVKFSYKP